MSTKESIVISDLLLKPESRGNGRLLAARVVYLNLPEHGRCRLVGQTHPEQDARQGENSVCTYKQEPFNVGIALGWIDHYGQWFRSGHLVFLYVGSTTHSYVGQFSLQGLL